MTKNTNRIIVNAPEMEELAKPLLETRNFYGYFQYIETWGNSENETYCWRFYISGFTPDNKRGYILKWNQTYELIDIDELDRICINGRYYGHRYWNH